MNTTECDTILTYTLRTDVTDQPTGVFEIGPLSLND